MITDLYYFVPNCRQCISTRIRKSGAQCTVVEWYTGRHREQRVIDGLSVHLSASLSSNVN